MYLHSIQCHYNVSIDDSIGLKWEEKKSNKRSSTHCNQ